MMNSKKLLTIHDLRFAINDLLKLFLNENNHLAHTLFNLGDDLVFYQIRTRRFAADKFCRRQIYPRGLNIRNCHLRSKNSTSQNQTRLEIARLDGHSTIFNQLQSRLLERTIYFFRTRCRFASDDFCFRACSSLDSFAE